MTKYLTCAHKKCGKPVDYAYARYKYVEGKGLQPYHTRCSYAHPDYDVSLNQGSPFTTINLRTI